MADVKALLLEMQDATNKYVAEEKKRLENEATVLKAILNGRTAGKGVMSTPVAEASRAAYASLDKFMKGKKIGEG